METKLINGEVGVKGMEENQKVISYTGRNCQKKKKEKNKRNGQKKKERGAGWTQVPGALLAGAHLGTLQTGSWPQPLRWPPGPTEEGDTQAEGRCREGGRGQETAGCDAP